MELAAENGLLHIQRERLQKRMSSFCRFVVLVKPFPGRFPKTQQSIDPLALQ
jgi:hypothetical protein